MTQSKFRKFLKKLWYFLWEENSVWSWIANIALAFILIKFVVYPGIGLILGTNYPIVAVVSGSMEHGTDSRFRICNRRFAPHGAPDVHRGKTDSR